jgi:hypothetical protein
MKLMRSGTLCMSEFDLPAKEIAKRMTLDERLMRVGFPEGVTPRQANAIMKARIQFGLSQLADNNIEKVEQWLREVGSRSPAEAIRLFMELLEFGLPRMKAMQINANADLTPPQGSRDMATMSIEELQSIVAEQG